MSVVLIACIVGLLVASVIGYARNRRGSRQPSPAELELGAMRAAARIRHMANAAEDYMDAFVQRRQAELRQQQRRWPS